VDAPIDRDVPSPETGAAFRVHDDVRVARVAGADARSWLHDLVTADVATLEPHRTRRTLLLTPTGRVRADIHVLAREDGSFLLAQREDQPEEIVSALGPYVLSSAVEVEATEWVALSVLDPAHEGLPGTSVWRPSIVDGGAFDLLEAPANLAATRDRLAAAGLAEISAEALEPLRILRGIPRFGRDFGPDSLPAEAGLDSLIDTEKGCFLGQESVAKVRNLGHPPRVLRHLSCPGRVDVGSVVLAAAVPVGEVTSAAPGLERDTTVMLARVRWNAAASALALEDGTPLSVVA
jgi:folate-binding protein YgfZ